MGRCEAVDVRFLARWKKMSGASHPLNLGPIGLEPDQDSGCSPAQEQPGKGPCRRARLLQRVEATSGPRVFQKGSFFSRE